MNNQLIKKVIKCNNEPCPELSFNYENPLLDRNVSQALSKSFVKLLNASEQCSNSSSSLRHSVLENIRKLCTVEPENHIRITDNFTDMVSEFYQNQIEESSNRVNSVDKMLDAFLIKSSLENNITSRFQTSLSPEVVQALLNLNEPGSVDIVWKQMIHWNTQNEKYLNVLKDLWNNNVPTWSKDKIDNLCVKMKPEIERMILEQCLKILEKQSLDTEDMYLDIENIAKTSAVSPVCFQICIGSLNFLFIATNFDSRIHNFILTFVKYVKEHSTNNLVSALYPIHLSNAIVLLDIDVIIIPKDIKDQYIKQALNIMQQIHEQSEKDLILLLSHYPQWFDVYFPEQEASKT